MNRDSLNRVEEVIEKHVPEIIITHWPIDTHSDHRSVGILTIGAVRNIDSKDRPLLYFYEVMTGKQTHCFIPEIYIYRYNEKGWD